MRDTMKNGDIKINKFSAEQIKAYWTEQAKKYGQSQSVSWSDHRAIKLEIKEILKYLFDGDMVLDIGCANGYSTIKFAMEKNIKIKGVDYVPEMVDQANIRVKQDKEKLLGDVTFVNGNILDLKNISEMYDKVVITRVLINLKDWNEQIKAISECSRVLKCGGMLLVSEATLQGWRRLNKLREEWNLSPITMPLFNEYIDEDKVVMTRFPGLELVDVVNFSSTYFIGTRVIKPLLIKALGLKMDPADPDAEWNKLCSDIPSWGSYGTQKLFILKKNDTF